MSKISTKFSQPKFMTGVLYWVNKTIGSAELKSLKQFRANCYTDPPLDKVSRGNIIPKQIEKEEYIIFHCATYYGTEPSFRLFLYENGEAWGTVLYQRNSIDSNTKEFFKGHYKKYSKNKIVIWGVWSEYKDFTDPWPIIVELSRTR